VLNNDGERLKKTTIISVRIAVFGARFELGTPKYEKGVLTIRKFYCAQFFSYCQGFLEASLNKLNRNPTQGRRITKDRSKNKPFLIIVPRKDGLESVRLHVKTPCG
jgi:hypothetical protein